MEGGGACFMCVQGIESNTASHAGKTRTNCQKFFTRVEFCGKVGKETKILSFCNICFSRARLRFFCLSHSFPYSLEGAKLHLMNRGGLLLCTFYPRTPKVSTFVWKKEECDTCILMQELEAEAQQRFYVNLLWRKRRKGRVLLLVHHGQ